MTLILATDTNPGLAEWIDSSLIGGGCTVIADGGTLSGDYDCNVVCLGDVSLAGSVEIRSNLFVSGTLTNTAGYDLTVRGDLHGHAIDFTRTDTSLAQGAFQVDGDLFYTILTYPQYAGAPQTLRVGGDLTGILGISGSLILANGNFATSGASILVYGDLMGGEVYVNGASATGSAAAGNGGSVIVYGNATIVTRMEVAGGPGAVGFDAGNGGTIDIYGSLIADDATISGSGGSGSDASAGNGGTLDVHGNLTCRTVEFSGGLCTSDSETHRSGSGGVLVVGGFVASSTAIRLIGNDRYGTLSAGNTLTPPNGGSFTCRADTSADDLDLRGGDVYTVGFAPHDAGSGGSVTVQGNLTLDDDLFIFGGYANVGQAGSGGSITIQGNLTCDDIDGWGGTGAAGNGGSGASVSVDGHARIGDLQLYGGDGNEGNGGFGGSCTVDGLLHIEFSLILNGGGCYAASEIPVAGNGGSLSCGSLVIDADEGTVTLNGGDRTGPTTVTNTGAAAANGGSVNVVGSAAIPYMNLNGGVVAPGFPHAPGGNGGSIFVGGTLTVRGDLNLVGGSSTGNSGGNGGTLDVRGLTTALSINASGGNSNLHGTEPTVGTNGAGGNIILISGVSATNIYLNDGAGGNPAVVTAGTSLALSNACTLEVIDQAARVGSTIRWSTYAPCVLKVNSLPTKNTFDDYGGVSTADQTAFIATSIYTTDGTNWVRLSGATI